MTDEEWRLVSDLDVARARKATAELDPKMTEMSVADAMDMAVRAARLAREGWTPEDPLLNEAREIVRSDTWHGLGGADELALRALRRGIEIGKREAEIVWREANTKTA